VLLCEHIGDRRLFARGQPAGCLAQIDAHDLRTAVETRVLVPQVLQHLQIKAAEIIARIVLTRKRYGHHLRKLRGIRLLHAAGVPDLGGHAALDLGSVHAAAVKIERQAIERQGINLRLPR